MEEIVIKVDIPAEFKEEFKLALAKLMKEFVRTTELLTLKERLESKEEKELIDWSVKLGRKAKKESFKRLLSELSLQKRHELLNSMSPKKRQEYE